MSQVPNNLIGLLRFCIEVGKEPTGTIQPTDAERSKWLREALESSTADLVTEMKQRISTVIQNIYDEDSISKKDETSSALDDLIDFTEDINIADIFLKIGGLELLKDLLSKAFDDYIAQSGMLLSNVMQNHPEAQTAAIDAGLLEITLNLLMKEHEPANLGGLLSGISSLVRGCEKSLHQFLKLNGFEFIFEVLEEIEDEEIFTRFIEKASFFIYCISQELSEEQLSELVSSNISDRIANLILHFKLPREFLVRALTLLLAGRVSTFSDPLTQTAPNLSKLAKLTLKKEAVLSLREWLKTTEVQLRLDPVALESFSKALDSNAS
ncbi:hypothetical protein Aperf_G00000029151 [Anoplocephala perfoliata]